MNLDNIYKTFENFNSHSDDYLGALYINVFHNFPRAYRVYYNENEELTYQDAIESFQEQRKNIKKKIDSRKLLQNILKDYKKYNKEIHYGQSRPDHILCGSKVFCYSPHEYLVLGDYYKYEVNSEAHHYTFLMNITLSEDGDMANYYEEIFCDPEDIKLIFDHLKNYFVGSTKEEKVDFGIAAIDPSNSIYTTWYDYNAKEVDIDKNYNDDFKPVYEKLCHIIEEEDKPGLVLFYGEPGTGKSTILKHLISKYPDKEFVFIDDQLLMNASPEKLLTYFLESQNTIFILEDCEKALTSRDKGYNPVMSTLLNLTDGIIAGGDTATFVYDGTNYHLLCVDRPAITGGEIDNMIAGVAAPVISESMMGNNFVITAENGATIYYTTDGTTPTTASTQYTQAVSYNATMTVKAIATKDGKTSPVASQEVHFKNGGNNKKIKN